MTCAPEINRSFPTRDGALRYLTSRGFLCGPQGWSNGRWAATVTHEHNAFHVAVWLAAPLRSRVSRAGHALPIIAL